MIKKYPKIEEVPDLFLPISQNNIEKVKYFLEKDPTLANQYNVYDGSALHVAIYKKNLDIVKLLIENEANIYTLDYNHINCINYAKKQTEFDSSNFKAKEIYDLLISIDEKNQLDKSIVESSIKKSKNKL